MAAGELVLGIILTISGGATLALAMVVQVRNLHRFALHTVTIFSLPAVRTGLSEAAHNGLLKVSATRRCLVPGAGPIWGGQRSLCGCAYVR